MACPALEAVPAGTVVAGKAHTQAEISGGTTEAVRGGGNRVGGEIGLSEGGSRVGLKERLVPPVGMGQ